VEARQTDTTEAALEVHALSVTADAHYLLALVDVCKQYLYKLKITNIKPNNKKRRKYPYVYVKRPVGFFSNLMQNEDQVKHTRRQATEA
jgi:hypothetical protein